MISRGHYTTVSGKGFRPRVIDLRGLRYPAVGFATVYMLALFVLPALLMLWASFQPYYAAPSADAARPDVVGQLSRGVSQHGDLSTPPTASSSAVFAATIVVMLSAVSAWITVRTRIRGRQLLDVMAFVPIAIPGLVLGVAMVDLYAASPLPIYGTLVVLIITYVIKFLPYGMRSSTSTIVQVSRELEEASAVAGGRWWHTFTRVLLPLLRPGLFAAWVYIFIVATRELSSSIILAGPRNTPLAVLIYQLYTNGDYTLLSALGVLMVVVLALLVFVFQRLGGSPTDGRE